MNATGNVTNCSRASVCGPRDAYERGPRYRWNRRPQFYGGAAGDATRTPPISGLLVTALGAGRAPSAHASRSWCCGPPQAALPIPHRCCQRIRRDARRRQPFTAVPTCDDSATRWPAGRCSVPDVVPYGYSDPPPGKGFSDTDSNRLPGSACHNGLAVRDGAGAARLREPDGQAMTVSLAKRQSAGSPRLGNALPQSRRPRRVWSSTWSTASIAKGWKTTTSIGWDPRGIGGSTPVKCYSQARLDHYLSLDASPDDDAELEHSYRGP